jgi:SNF-related kinase
VFQTSNNTYLITEFCDGGDLASKITKNTRQSEQFTQNIIMGVVQGYKEMKKKGTYSLLILGIIHRDIKPANVLIQNGVPKIADFGFATTPNSPPMLPNVNVGSPLYMSPQALK